MLGENAEIFSENPLIAGKGVLKRAKLGVKCDFSILKALQNQEIMFPRFLLGVK